ncbi:2-keto-4-pentenoate hydratase [Clostridium magnum]|uniref:2-hydroxypent-2,4-dienoate hydratase n=1 Tax=Clostridium magnum DSM 2767 TaxID=1121326 RepID=A0A162U7E1_9CLOT|nr:fumarylacetoacetate hydrolase family protein [Clostridium magnum]KZL93617.1 2-hydroxypent-2,4-dienoate hydratase [Clostridium magnum DSM 2767]SHI57641.1 2-keto-4-pentenoate hydratase [Clostridium magnum DSM 2767]
MNQEQIKEAAAALYEAEEKVQPITALTDVYPDITTDDAYKIQIENIARKVQQGYRIVGKKIGLTSKGMQQMLGVPEPDYGHILDNMVGEEEVPIKISSFLKPKIEAEIGFILKDELKGPGVTVAQVLQATEGVMPVFEIVDSRVKDWKIKIQDTVADNASSAMIVLGSNLVSVKDLDLKHIGMVLEKNGKVIDTAAGAEVLGNPAIAVAWLANKLGEYGISLKPGEIILSGSLTKAYEFDEKCVFTATFDRLGRVKAVFE